MSLPKLSAQQPIVTTGGKPSSPFLQFMEAARKAQEATDAQQGEAIDALEAINGQLQTAVAQIEAALALAGLALEVADGMGGGTARTGNVIDTLAGATTTYQTVVQVDLLTVSAGDLSLAGSFYNVSFASLPIGVPYYLEFRIIEVDNGVDNGTVYSGSATVTQTSAIDVTLVDTSAVSLGAFTDTRTTTGSISYRVEMRTTTTWPTSVDFTFRLIVRRA